MMRLIIGLFTGSLFGAGLVIAQMTDPNRVLGFLDVSGHWDPRLGFVLFGAIAVHAPVVLWSRRRAKPALAGSIQPPAQSHIDLRLVAGAAVFGLGWGLAGYCPGPALASALTNRSALLLTLSMIGGMLIHDRLLSHRVAPGVFEQRTHGDEELTQGQEASERAPLHVFASTFTERAPASVQSAFGQVPPAEVPCDKRS
jgi:uncharacterized protein